MTTGCNYTGYDVAQQKPEHVVNFLIIYIRSQLLYNSTLVNIKITPLASRRLRRERVDFSFGKLPRGYALVKQYIQFSVRPALGSRQPKVNPNARR